MKWACVGVSKKEKMRFECLQKHLGSDHEVSFMEWRQDGDWEADLRGFQHIRWGEDIQVDVSKRLKAHSTWTALLGVTDGMVTRDGRWWPLCASYEALCQTVTDLGEGLDIQGSAFVSGTGASARAGIAALFRNGFRKFRLVALNLESAEGLVRDIRLKFFGIDLEVVPADMIVLLAGVSSVFVNTLSEDEAPDLVQEISYLNFLKRPGAIIDANMFTKQTLLLKEAMDSAIPMVDGWDLAARIDSLWTKWAFSKELDHATYGKDLKTAALNLRTD